MDREISIRVKNLSRRFGAAWAIKNISFTVAKGEIVGFLGPNGAGKHHHANSQRHSQCPKWFSMGGGISVARNPHEVKRRIGYTPKIILCPMICGLLSTCAFEPA